MRYKLYMGMLKLELIFIHTKIKSYEKINS